MDIKAFLKNLSTFAQIDFKGKESELAPLAGKYDTNRNSVFEKNELIKIKEDLSIFMSAEGDSDDISDRELWYFYQSLQPKGRTIIDAHESVIGQEAYRAEGLLSGLDEIFQDRIEYINNLYNESGRRSSNQEEDINMLMSLPPEQLERAKSLLNIEGRKKQFSAHEIIWLLEFTDKAFEKARRFFYIKERGDNQFSVSDMVDLIKIPDTKMKRAEELFYIEGREDNQFSGSCIDRLLELSDEQFEKAKQLFYIEGRKPEQQLGGYAISELVNLPKDKFERVQALLHVKNRKEPFYGFDILALAPLSDKKFERAETLFNIPGIDAQYSGKIIAELSELSDTKFERAKSLFLMKRNGKLLNPYDILHLARLSKNQYEEAMKLLDDEEFKEIDASSIAKFVKLSIKEKNRARALLKTEGQRFGGDVVDFAQLPDDEFKRAVSLFDTKIQGKELNDFEIKLLAKLKEDEFKRAQVLIKKYDRFSAIDISELATLTEDELKRVDSLLDISCRIEQFRGDDLVALAKLKDEDLAWARENLFSRNYLHGTACAKIAQNHCDEVLEYIDNQMIIKIDYTAEDCIKFDAGNGKTYAYDKSGLIETSEEEKLPDTDKIKNRIQTTVFNKKLNVRQVIIKGEIIGADDKSKVLSEVLTYYDKDGNVTRTVTMKVNPDNNVLNVSETDKDGNQNSIQWQSVDSDTGARITERHFTSPEGVKTDYYAEENENLRVMEYKITAKKDETMDGDKDEDDDVLIYVRQTFEQISDNKFISSINTTNDPANTKIYEMEYTKDGYVIILDKKNNKTTKINLNEYFTGTESSQKLLPILKQLPGHVLLEFAEKPFDLDYGEDNIQNGFWRLEESLLQVGNYDNTIGEEENLLATLAHELGHYLDLYNRDRGLYNSNPKIVAIYKQEFEEFKKKTTTFQQDHISYFTNLEGEERGNEEKVAETHAIFNTVNDPQLNMRRFYLAKYFPRTMAAIMELLLAEEGIKD